MTILIETLAAELERPRAVSAQVTNHLIGTYGISREAVGDFFVNELPRLEDYEIDLILSPLFTPTLKDQAVFAELLGSDSVPASEWPELVRQLGSRPARATLLGEDGVKRTFPLREVTLERYVHRLRLDGTIHEPPAKLVNAANPPADRPMLKAVARRAVWEDESRRAILVRHLTATPTGGDVSIDDVVGLLKLVETYQPGNVAELLSQIPHWRRVVQQEISNASAPKPFFNERVQELHGGGRDQRRQEQPRIIAKENELAFLERLHLALSQ